METRVAKRRWWITCVLGAILVWFICRVVYVQRGVTFVGDVLTFDVLSYLAIAVALYPIFGAVGMVTGRHTGQDAMRRWWTLAFALGVIPLWYISKAVSDAQQEVTRVALAESDDGSLTLVLDALPYFLAALAVYLTSGTVIAGVMLRIARRSRASQPSTHSNLAD